MKRTLIMIAVAFFALTLSRAVLAYYPEGETLDWKAEIKAIEAIIENAKKQKKVDDEKNFADFKMINEKLDNVAKAIEIMTDDGKILNPEERDQEKCFIKQIVLRIKAREIYEDSLNTMVFYFNANQKEKSSEVMEVASKFYERCYEYYSFLRNNEGDLSEVMEKEYLDYCKRNNDEMERTNGDISTAINDLKNLLEETRRHLNRPITQ